MSMRVICWAAGFRVNSLKSNMKHGVGIPAALTPRAALHMPAAPLIVSTDPSAYSHRHQKYASDCGCLEATVRPSYNRNRSAFRQALGRASRRARRKHLIDQLFEGPFLSELFKIIVRPNVPQKQRVQIHRRLKAPEGRLTITGWLRATWLP